VFKGSNGILSITFKAEESPSDRLLLEEAPNMNPNRYV